MIVPTSMKQCYAMSESDLLFYATGLCDWFKVLHYHTHDSRRSEPGFPDLVIVGRKILYRELKTERGELTPEQRRWSAKIIAAGGDWQLWRPSDMLRMEAQIGRISLITDTDIPETTDDPGVA